MRRRRWLALVGAAALVLTPVMAGAAPLTSAQTYQPVGFFRFCAEAQLDIANINETLMTQKGISIGGTIYENYATDFVSSKSAVDTASKRILTDQWTEYFDAAKLHPRTIRCKLRTGESISKGAWPAGALNNAGRFAVDPAFGFGSLANGVSTGTDQSCTVVNQRTIDNVWANLTSDQQTASHYKPTDSTLVTGPDVVTGEGPTWLEDTPPLAISGGVLTATARSLVANTGSANTPRFEGAHYCTLVPPQYLRDVLLGTATVS